MSHRRRGWTLTAVVSVSLIVGQVRHLGAANCRGTVVGDAIRTGGYVGSDGKVHYRVGYGPGVTAAHIGAIQHAMNMWNDEANITGIVLEEVTSGSPDFRFQPNTSPNPGGCARYMEGGSYIWYSPSYMAFAVTDTQLAGRVYAHELGHALGLHHKGGYSIMLEPPPGVQTCYDGAQYLPSAVAGGDASDVDDCAHAAHAATRYGPPPSYFLGGAVPDVRNHLPPRRILVVSGRVLSRLLHRHPVLHQLPLRRTDPCEC